MAKSFGVTMKNNSGNLIVEFYIGNQHFSLAPVQYEDKDDLYHAEFMKDQLSEALSSLAKPK